MDENTYTLLYDSIYKNDISKVKELLPSVALTINDDYGFGTILYHACSYNKVEIVKLLLEQPNIDINIKKEKDYNAHTPLHIACYHQYIEVVKLLLEQPFIDVNSQDNSGNTPLDLICKNNNIEIIKLLLKHPKIQVNSSKNKRFNCLLNLIAKRTYSEIEIEIIKLLVFHPSTNINITYNHYSASLTVLQIACFKDSIIDSIKVIKLLLTHPKLDINFRNDKGFSALYLSSINNHIETVNLLLEHPKIKIDFNYNICKNFPEIRNLLKDFKNDNKSITKILDSIEE